MNKIISLLILTFFVLGITGCKTTENKREITQPSEIQDGAPIIDSGEVDSGLDDSLMETEQIDEDLDTSDLEDVEQDLEGL